MFRFACLLVFAISPSFAFDPNSTTLMDRLGHSAHGDAFDTGPREKPWVIDGIGVAHFPITTRNPEVQKWFDQGNALLHSFWDYEAERAFRWCLKLEPDNAMAYWGLARASEIRGLGGANRPAEMIREAIKRKDKVTPRERLYIEAMAAEVLPDPLHEGSAQKDGRERSKNILETLCVEYPDDMEARALLALEHYGQRPLRHRTDGPRDSGQTAGSSRRPPLSHPQLGLQRTRNRPGERPPLRRNRARYRPRDPHARTHLQHRGDVERSGTLDGRGHAPREAIHADRMTFPFNNWNYGHNRTYLSYIQEQLGMADSAIFGARQLIDAPLDPQGNTENFL